MNPRIEFKVWLAPSLALQHWAKQNLSETQSPHFHRSQHGRWNPESYTVSKGCPGNGDDSHSLQAVCYV